MVRNRAEGEVHVRYCMGVWLTHRRGAEGAENGTKCSVHFGSLGSLYHIDNIFQQP